MYVPPTSTVEKCINRIYDRNEDGDMDITDSPIQLQNMYNRKSNTYVEHKIFPYVTKDDLRIDLMDKVRNLAKSKNPDHQWLKMSDDEIMKSAGLWEKDFSSGIQGYNLAGVLLFGKDDVIRSCCDLKDLFNNKLLRQDIVCACASYYNSSAKAHRKEAVNRFLSAIDLFYKNYIKKMGGIECSALEGGCRNNEMIEDIEKCLNTKLKQEIYCPIDDKIEIEIIKICNNLKKSDFYKFGQKILCNLLLKYGFKLNLLVNLKKDDVNDIDGIITIRNKDSVINLSVDKSMVSDIRQYNMVHRYPNREYFFLNTKGKKITSSSALATIQEKLEEVNNINTTTLALKGVSKLIQKGLTLSEIKYLTGFETKKIEDVSRWLMNQEDVESVINNKLNLIDI